MTAWRLREDYAQRVEASVDGLRGDGFGADVAVVLGSGLGNFVDRLTVDVARPFGEIDGFTVPSVEAHSGRLVQGRVPDGDREVLVLQGRLHAYEGHAMEDVLFPVATLLGLGVKTLILTNAAGGLYPTARAGDLMVITGLLDFHGDALRGLVLPPTDVPVEVSLRAATGSDLLDRELALELAAVGARESIDVTRGTYVSLWGPSYETPREIGALRGMGADAVGMSTGPEASLAHRLGARVAGISCITNVSREAGVKVVTHDEVIEVGAARREDLAHLLLAFLGSLSL